MNVAAGTLLKGKVAMVTGGGRGLGFAIATALSEAGATVVLSSRKLDSCVAAAARISEATGGAVRALGLEVSEALWDKTLEVNLKGPFRLMAVAGDRMMRQGGGSIVNISSIGAERPSAPEAMYAAAKNGLNALTRAFAQELAPVVRVNGVMPGAFATDMAASWDDRFRHLVLDRLPAGRLGRPDELASMVVFLASDESGYTTGALIPVDGGRTAVY